MLGGQLESDLSLENYPTPTPIQFPMSSKKQKLSLKRSRASEEPTHDYDHEKLSKRARPRNSASSRRIGPSSRRRGFTTLMISFAKPLRTRDGGHFANL